MKKLKIIALLVLSIVCYNARADEYKDFKAREHQYDVKFYFLDLDIEASSNTISGNSLISVKSLVDNFDTVSIELSGFTIDSIKASLDGGLLQNANRSVNGGQLNVLLPFFASVNQTVNVRVYYHGIPSSNAVFGGGGGFPFGNTPLFTETPPYFASLVFPCKQDLNDKADSSWFFITTVNSDLGLSNGLLTNKVNLGSKTRWEWKSKYPIDFYLISFDVGPFTEYTAYWHPEGRTDSMLLKGYGTSPPDTKILDIYSKLFGLYPFYKEKLGIANVNLSGGMENQTLISLGAQYHVEPHEIAHQWWGDNVTCGSYKDVFLNEGFATWCESVYDEFSATGASNQNTARISHCNGFESSALSSASGSVYGGNDTVTFGGVYDQVLHYKKGAMIVNSLRFEVNNDSLFFLGLRNYQTQFGGKTALGKDLKAVMETTTGKDFTDFFNQWYYGHGYPSFNLKWNQVSNQLLLRITEVTSSSLTPLFKTSLEIKVKRTEGDTIIRLFIPENVTDYIITMPGTITGFTVDPNQWVLNKTGTVTKDISTGMNALASIQTSHFIVPNPAENTITIGGADNAVDVRIYDVRGALRYSKNNYKINEAIDISNLHNGIYFVEIIDAKNSSMVELKKLVKN